VEINLKDYLRIKEAGREGKIRTHRHPINGYRLYRKADLDALLTAVHHSAKAAPTPKGHGQSK
jgi:hypothetical protein